LRCKSCNAEEVLMVKKEGQEAIEVSQLDYEKVSSILVSQLLI
jgi:hypothetical protein